MPQRRATSVFATLLAVFLSVASASAQASILAPQKLRQGDPLLVWILAEPGAAPHPSPLVARLVDSGGRTVASARCFPAQALLETARPLLGALMALAPGLPPGPYELRAGGATASIEVQARSFATETIKLDEANTRLRTAPSERKEKEARRLYALLSKVDDSAIFAEAGSFMFPAVGGWRSAGFGDVRRYAFPDGNSDRSVHAGIDWAVAAGTAVHACARGKVVMAVDREVTGKTLVLEHLPGLYSIYMHLSAIEVKEGDIVERASRVALSGSTGMSTGPHLHWELRAKGDAVDPEYWLGAPLLDKSAITAIMHGLIEGR
jgi:hypothetical protein